MATLTPKQRRFRAESKRVSEEFWRRNEAVVEQLELRAFKRRKLQPGDWDGMAAKLRKSGLVRRPTEGAKEYSRRALERLDRNKLKKPFRDVLSTKPGRPPRLTAEEIAAMLKHRKPNEKGQRISRDDAARLVAGEGDEQRAKNLSAALRKIERRKSGIN